MSVFTIEERRILVALSEPLPLTERPYEDVARRAGVPEAMVIARLQAWIEQGVIRRIAARIRHHAAGYPANGMSVWRVSLSEVDHAARIMVDQPEVSHCYQRPERPDWPYTLYAMIHGHDEEEVGIVARRIATLTGLMDYQVLFTVHEYKKAAPRFFVEDTT